MTPQEMFPRTARTLFLARNGYVDAGAEGERAFRYLLWRTWDHLRPVLPWIMLNPSNAGELVDDPSVRRVVGFSKGFGYGGMVIANVNAYRATDPREMLTRGLLGANTVNNEAILNAIGRGRRQGREVVVAWGAWGARCPELVDGVLELLRRASARPMCLGTTRDGHPLHPLRLASSTRLVPWGWS